MFKNLCLVTILSFLAIPALANQDCYKLTPVDSSLSRTPEGICIEYYNYPRVLATLYVSQRAVAMFDLSFITQVKGTGFVNQVHYAIPEPMTGGMNQVLSIRFEGHRSPDGRMQSGRVTIGLIPYHFESI